jgi:hypothetical protein
LTETPASRIERIYNGSDACSVGTVASRMHSKHITGQIDNDTDVDSTTDSISTNATTKSGRNATDKKLVVMEANLMQTQRAVLDMTAMLVDIQKQLQGSAAVTPVDTSRHITINDSTTQPKAAPRAGSRKVSGGKK